MTPEQIQALIDATLKGADKVNSYGDGTLIFLGAFMALVVVIISLSLVFVVVRLLAVQTLFINAMTTRSVMANEQIRLSTDTQTQAITGQTNAITAINQTGMATGAAVSAVSDKVSMGLSILKALDINVDELAKHASNPTAGTKQKVDEIADKAEQKTPTPATDKPAAEAAPATVEVALPVTLVAAAEVPAG